MNTVGITSVKQREAMGSLVLQGQMGKRWLCPWEACFVLELIRPSFQGESWMPEQIQKWTRRMTLNGSCCHESCSEHRQTAGLTADSSPFEALTKTTEEIILHTSPFRKYIVMELKNFTNYHVQGYTECRHRPCPAEKFDRKTLCLLVTAVWMLTWKKKGLFLTLISTSGKLNHTVGPKHSKTKAPRPKGSRVMAAT